MVLDSHTSDSFSIEVDAESCKLIASVTANSSGVFGGRFLGRTSGDGGSGGRFLGLGPYGTKDGSCTTMPDLPVARISSRVALAFSRSSTSLVRVDR